jgi:DNA-binding transcriptional LysR family regulator
LKLRAQDLPLLRTLDALLDEQNVSAAAVRLDLSQSTVSGHLGQLRELFDDPLLVPSEHGRGMVATDRALRLQMRLRRTMEEIETLLEDPAEFDPSVDRRRFIVAMNDNVFSVLGAAVVGAMLDRYGATTQINVVPPDAATLLTMTEQGDIDLYVGIARVIPNALKQRVLSSDTFCGVQHVDRSQPIHAMTLDEYISRLHVVVSVKGEMTTPVDAALDAMGASRRVGASVSSYGQVPALLANSSCMATMPRKLARSWGDQFETLELPFALEPFVLSMAWHPRAQVDRAQQWLRAQFLQASNDI